MLSERDSAEKFGELILPLDELHDIRINKFLPCGTNHVFNEPEYFKLHARGRGYYFQLCRSTTAEVLATGHFTEAAPGQFKSPARGTSGGYQAADGVAFDTYERFVSAVDAFLKGKGARLIQIALPPSSHDPRSFAVSFNILSRGGYKIARHELNYDMCVDAVPVTEKMSHGSRKRLNKCARANFTARLLDPSQHELAHRAIVENRRRKNYTAPMSYEDLKRQSEAVPGRTKCFAVYQGGTIVASAVCVLLSSKILYVLYWGDVDNMQSYSPIVSLLATIYDYCHANMIELLDVGTSTERGQPLHGLIEFKRNLGFSESLKLTFAKDL